MEEVARGSVYSPVELSFAGPRQTAKDAPARDVQFWARFKHESGSPEYKVFGFWDGDGKSGIDGNVFKIRFSPTKAGRWELAEVHSNAKELDGQMQGDYVVANASKLHGFWLADTNSPQSRWYQRSDGSHQYIIGNTHYSFLSGRMTDDKPTGNDIVEDVAANARFFKKLRIGLYGDHYPHPTEKPFFDDDGRPTDDGDFSHRPNPRWFHQRVDAAVTAGFDRDLIIDLILAGPDVDASRAPLRASHNGGDPAPYLRYIAARYASYPNVWLCLINEFNIRDVKFKEDQIARFGGIMRGFLAYPTPLSVHTVPATLWPKRFDELPLWNDHIILQKKLRAIAPAADVNAEAVSNPGGKPRHMPVINDELSYQGAGDKHNEGDAIASHLGAFLGGGYGSTGEKHGNKLGQYFWGKFDPKEHSAVDNLNFLRTVVDRNITFWRMSPGADIFSNLDGRFRAMSWPGHEYVLGTDKEQTGLVAKLPPGRWTVTRHDVIAMKSETLTDDAGGDFRFDASGSRAVVFHFKNRN